MKVYLSGAVYRQFVLVFPGTYSIPKHLLNSLAPTQFSFTYSFPWHLLDSLAPTQFARR